MHYFLNPWSRVLLEKLTAFQLVNKFFEFYGAERFISVFTSARQLSLSLARWMQPLPPNSTSWRSILILSSHVFLSIPSSWYPQVSPPQPCMHFSLPPYLLRTPTILFTAMTTRTFTSVINQQMCLYKFHIKHLKSLRHVSIFFRSSSGSHVSPC